MKVESYKIKGWKEKEVGLLIDENDDWILVNSIPVDYVIDGFKLYRKKFVKKRTTKSAERKVEKVFGLKEIQIVKPDKFNFGNTVKMLEWVENRYDLFEFSDDSQEEVFYGKMNRVEGDNLIIDMVMSDGKIEKEYDYKFSMDRIRSITFSTNYFESIRLLMYNEMNT